MKLSESVKPISYFKAHASEIVRQIANRQQPMVITQNGEAKAILQDIVQYEQTPAKRGNNFLRNRNSLPQSVIQSGKRSLSPRASTN